MVASDYFKCITVKYPLAMRRSLPNEIPTKLHVTARARIPLEFRLLKPHKLQLNFGLNFCAERRL